MKTALIRPDLRQQVINAAGKLIHVSQVTGAQPSTVDTTLVSRLEKTNRETHVKQINDFADSSSPWRPFVSEIRKTALQSHEKISQRKRMNVKLDVQALGKQQQEKRLSPELDLAALGADTL